jgi:S-adenosylmethionine uptake transporter
MNSVTVKILGKTEKSKTQMFYLMLFACLWVAPFVFIQWDPISVFGFMLDINPTKIIGFSGLKIGFQEVKYLLFMALCYFVHGVAYFKALKRELSIVITFRYTKLLFSGVLGYVFFNEIPEKASYVGYILIILSGLVLLGTEINKVRTRRKKLAV